MISSSSRDGWEVGDVVTTPAGLRVEHVGRIPRPREMHARTGSERDPAGGPYRQGLTADRAHQDGVGSEILDAPHRGLDRAWLGSGPDADVLRPHPQQDA